ncbi:MAG: AbrB/MazE/SpoVT family DNA-binding domain-containing protein [Candidatus Heimdallarchaeota archaeon]
MSKITVDEKGRIVIPEEERKALGLEPGMTLQLERKGKELIIRKVVSFEEFTSKLKGCITKKGSKEEIKPLELKTIWKKNV